LQELRKQANDLLEHNARELDRLRSKVEKPEKKIPPALRPATR